jgi:predicted nucleic acid-binding protein
VTAERGLLDTNIVILLPRLTDVSALPRVPLISAITLAELSAGALIAMDDLERAARQAELQEAETSFETLPFDADAARAYGQVAGSLRRSGRKGASRTYDAMIAAVAIANELALFTCNPRDFEGIDDLIVVTIPHPDADESRT